MYKRREKVFFLEILLFMLLGLQSSIVMAQSMGIAAIVNDEIISLYDLKTRVSAVLALSGLPNNTQTKNRVTPQVLRTLVNERIKIQEARRLKITPSKRQIDQEGKALEKRVGLKTGQLGSFFLSRDINPNAMIDQLESRAIWRLIITKRVGARLTISDAEIDEAISEIKNNKGKVENLISEIFIKISDPTKERDVVIFANRLIKKIRSGADFAAIAQNFSHDPSSRFGGDLGWTLRGKLNALLDSHIHNLKIGEIAGPIRSEGGIHILLLRDRRFSQGLDGLINKEVLLNLHQVHFRLSERESKIEHEKYFKQAQTLSNTINGCKNFKSEIKGSKSTLSGELGTFPLRTINPRLRTLVEGLPVGTASKPYRTKDSIIVLMVCSRTGSDIKKSDTKKIRWTIRRKLRDVKLNRMAKQFFRNLRRSSFVEIR